MTAKRHQFKTEVRQLLDLMINSLYSNREIFLRELVANAADAIDKARFESLTNPALTREWQIKIAVDKTAKTLKVSDNGIGMSRDEAEENLGTIAKSGTKAFVEALAKNREQGDAPELIGQFGVGFYSSFMVADKVEVVTRKEGCPPVKWSSKGEESYTVEEAERDEVGSDVILHLKDDATEFMDHWRIASVVRKYSDYIAYPIVMDEELTDKDGHTSISPKTLNSQKAIWLRPASEITDDEHKSFFAHLSGGGSYWKTISMTAEGASEFKALLYIPEKLPFNFMMPEFQKKGLQLYVKRVFITDECEKLIPECLQFVKGVVDSSDLPLNVSRELLQENPLLSRIQKAIAAKVFGELKKLLESERENYARFFREFGKILKIGLYNDFANMEKIQNLVMYETMNGSPGELITLKEYVAAMPEKQPDIYFITAENRKVALASPALEVYRKNGFDVLIMTDPIDEWVMNTMLQYDKKHFKPVSKGELELDEASKKQLDAQLEKAAKEHAELIAYIKSTLQDNISDVRFSGRLTESPCCLVAGETGMNSHLEKILKALDKNVPREKRILELNPAHPLLPLMEKNLKVNPASPELKDAVLLLYDQAVLADGGELPDPADFARRLSAVMLKAAQNP